MTRLRERHGRAPGASRRDGLPRAASRGRDRQLRQCELNAVAPRSAIADSSFTAAGSSMKRVPAAARLWSLEVARSKIQLPIEAPAVRARCERAAVEPCQVCRSTRWPNMAQSCRFCWSVSGGVGLSVGFASRRSPVRSRYAPLVFMRVRATRSPRTTLGGRAGGKRSRAGSGKLRATARPPDEGEILEGSAQTHRRARSGSGREVSRRGLARPQAALQRLTRRGPRRQRAGRPHRPRPA
jgi:hypothetical protein